jgi:lipopolysaccharide transport system ATP-binding protein
VAAMRITTHQLSKHYLLGEQSGPAALLRNLTATSTKPVGRPLVTALDKVSLDVNDGERVGVIGRNGAGKTTLLQLLAGLITPTSGGFNVTGRVDCVLSLGMGQRPDLTGRQSVYAEAELLGQNKRETEALMDRIEEFAELGRFFDLPLRTYSTGMAARLAFARLVTIDPQILLIDEALAVGDAAFAQNALNKLRGLCDHGRIVLLVSHSMPVIRDMCSRVIWLEGGQVLMDGEPEEITRLYQKQMNRESKAQVLAGLSGQAVPRPPEYESKAVSVQFLNCEGKARLLFEVGEEMTLRITCRPSRPMQKADLRLKMERSDGIMMFDSVASQNGIPAGPVEKKAVWEIPFGKLDLGKSTYNVLVDIFETGDPERVQQGFGALKIENHEYPYSNPARWTQAQWGFKQGQNQ